MLKSIGLFIFQHLSGITSSQNFNQLAMMWVRIGISQRIIRTLARYLLFCNVVNFSLTPFGSYFHFQKIIQSYVKTPILHCYFGTLRPTDVDANTKYVYILRWGASKIGTLNVVACAVPRTHTHGKLLILHSLITINIIYVTLILYVATIVWLRLFHLHIFYDLFISLSMYAYTHVHAKNRR